MSGVWPLPSWQTNVSTVFSKTHRNVPDVALNADPDTGYSIYYNGQWTIYGGTSCAAPLWAAFTARINQAAGGKSKAGIRLCESFSLCNWSLDLRIQQIFMTSHRGNNLYYSAGKGYDNASGWGSFNGAHLFEYVDERCRRSISRAPRI